MIDAFNDKLLTMTEAAKQCPKVRGKRPSNVTLWRWATTGRRGVKLEHVWVGRNMLTTEVALNVFFNGVANAPAVEERVPSEYAEVLAILKSWDPTFQHASDLGGGSVGGSPLSTECATSVDAGEGITSSEESAVSVPGDQSSDGDVVATDDPHNILQYAPAESQDGGANNPTGSDANSEAV